MAGQGWLRPGLRCAAAKAGHPARIAKSAGAADPRRPHPRRGDGQGHRQPAGPRDRRSREASRGRRIAGRTKKGAQANLRPPSPWGRNQSLVAMVLNVVDRFLPMLVIALIAASAIRAAINPYSMAVAPVSSLSRFAK